ncbi:tRNA (cytidine32/uridine32-2'-O)-methyltransferase [Mesocricetibacter intestinalis]|uniref:tRNA (cytidine/uridine-2'-O-)-methyltransferase TrmJ n=1 Tax=Mesocricetibacter intestinalis TaxID=1521930 RepID=A0A4R6VBT3_9PAST|nr:tRNA (cytosine(32)/uridine(32)-2'-O)-methyltransferase TrmJ [Mesocricetibacter intestinalis]TDQ59677.1 tRNA (cytidine32/uridine32-2'-O)-methyltransferase [Mesocricetibacter intestinalis]
MLNNIRIVLVETTHSGNIGSAARAMKTMGLSRLYLAAPKCSPDQQALALSAGAEDVVKNARLTENLDQAIADCSLVIGTSARLRHLQNSLIEPRQCAAEALRHAGGGEEVAIIFGRERIGLLNEELMKCRYHLTIPANPDYSSLNLAMAVQLISYELRMAWLQTQQEQDKVMPVSAIGDTGNKPPLYPTAQQLEHFFSHTEQCYRQLGFIQNQGVMPKLRRLYQRARLETNELNILQGMLTAVEKYRIANKDNS